MKRLCAIAALLLAAACAPPGPPVPQGLDETDVARFRTAVAEAGCRITDTETASIVERRTGYSERHLGELVIYLAGQGEVVEAGGTGFALVSGPCA